MQAVCQIEGHNSKPFLVVCTNPNCTNNRILCMKCLTTIHRECQDFTLEINDIQQRSLFDNINWINDKEIKNAVAVLHKYKLVNSKEHHFEQYEALISKQFDRLTEYFLERVKETKEKLLQRFRNSEVSSNPVTDNFLSQIKNLYDFDAFVSILEAWQRENKDINTVSKELDSFFKGIHSNQDQLVKLKAMASNLETSMKQFCVEQKAFDECRTSLDKMFHHLTLEQPVWKWDPKKKSPLIVLDESGKQISKELGMKPTDSGILANIELSKGKHRWEIEVLNNEVGYACFGIIQPDFVTSLEPFAYQKGIYQASSGHAHNMEKVNTLGNYLNKVYVCELDCEAGTFKISCEGVVTSQVIEGIRNKVFSPFVILSRHPTVVKLVSVKSL